MQNLPTLTSRSALFLDFDGTLIDITHRPDEVVISSKLIATLQILADQHDDAVAVISGREITALDRFLAPLRLAAAGEHGAQIRQANGSVSTVAPPELFIVSRAALRLATLYPKLLVEEKGASIALHYRHAPEFESLCLETLTEAVSRSPGTEILQGNQVFEVKAKGVSKGLAIASLMTKPPFHGRVPLFVGDDLTDEDGFAITQQLGGHGIKVGEGPTQAHYRCASPAVLRQWLQASAAGTAAPSQVMSASAA